MENCGLSVKSSNFEIPNLIDLEAQERKKLEIQSDAMIADLVAMEEAILSIEDITPNDKIFIYGYQGGAKECGYKIPQNVTDKIQSLL